MRKYFCIVFFTLSIQVQLLQAYKHIFTSPSSVDQEPKATRSGNARLHGMSEVTMASIAYVATMVSHLATVLSSSCFHLLNLAQVRFALSSTSTFSRTDYVTDSERFYNTLMELFTDIRARGRINELKLWWNKCVSCYLFQAITDNP